MLLSEFGDLYMWGWNEKGQLGLAVNPNDTLSSSGGQVQCQTVPVPVSFPEDLEVLMVSCGSRHTAAVLGMWRGKRMSLVDRMVGEGFNTSCTSGTKAQRLL